MSNEIESKIACVAGATAGIGLACAAGLLKAGFTRLVINGRSEQRGKAALESLLAQAPDADVRFVAADVSPPAGAQSLADVCVSAFGRIDVLVSVAGGAPLPRLLHEIPIED